MGSLLFLDTSRIRGHQKLPPLEPAAMEINVLSKQRGQIFTCITVVFEDLGLRRVLITSGRRKSKAHVLVYTHFKCLGKMLKCQFLNLVSLRSDISAI